MSGPLFVPDASVLLKWALRSPDEESAESALALKSAWLQGRVEIAVPSLWAFEVGNVLGLKQPSIAPLLLQALLDLALPEAGPQEYAPVMFKLMRQHEVTFYDAAYHGLAIWRGGTMLTADRRYVTRARSSGSAALIGEWNPT